VPPKHGSLKRCAKQAENFRSCTRFLCVLCATFAHFAVKAVSRQNLNAKSAKNRRQGREGISGQVIIEHMDSTRWQRMQNLFHDAADLAAAEQHSFLKKACDGDDPLMADVLAMLEEDAKGKSVLDRNVAQLADQVLDRPRRSDIGSKQFGPYLIKDVLGEGGMGVVYLAERSDLGSRVAIKILRDAWLSPARRERFASEQRTLAQLNHPSIARLYDADTLNDGTPWFVMEYVEGMPLTEYCQKYNCTIERRLLLFRQVCEAVQYAHAHAVIHRDLKPSNIFVKSDGSVRLLDFGIAKQVESMDSPVDQTRTVLRMMTPAYASPEQIRGDSIGVHTDVYSLGVILFELLTNRLPFDLSNLTPNEAASIIAGHEPGKPSQSAKETAIPPVGKTQWADLDVLCLKAMHKDTQRRYRSVEALVRDVDHYLKGEPLEARPDSLGYRAEKFVTRNWRAVSVATAVLLLVAGLSTVFTLRLAKARNAALAEAARTQRIQDFMVSVFQGGDEAAGPAADVKVVDMIDSGVHQAQALGSDPKVQSELLFNFAGIYQKLGQLAKAESLLQATLEQRKSLFGADSPEVAESLVAFGVLRSDQSRLDEAEQLTRQGLDMASRHLAANHPGVVKATLALGQILGERGSYDQAIQLLQSVVDVQSVAGVETADLAASLAALADANYNAGHYDVCVPLYYRVLEMHRHIYGPKHPLVAADLGSLGVVQVDLGYYDKAEDFNRQALAITESYYGKDSPKTALDLNALGQALQYEKKYDEAVALLERALAIRERAFGPMHSSVADTLNELGNIASMREQLDDAEAKFRRVVEIYRAVYGDNHYMVAIALSNVASIRMDKKDFAQAERIYRDVVRRFTETLAADNVNTGIARVKLGRTLMREKRFREAAFESLAGYDILIKQTNQQTSFVHAARKDLVADYEALRQPENASRFRAELESAENKNSTRVSKK
jgi:serine/threonine protein kinase/tetratricopeptide (TPR) repeat protein